MLYPDGSYKPCTQNDSAMLISQSHKKYMVHVYDHNRLFEDLRSVSTLPSGISNDLNLVVIVLKEGHSFDAKEKERLVALVNLNS